MSFTFAIGDIHGCLSELRDMLDHIEYQAPSGHIVFIGDYIDRGPASRGVVELVWPGRRGKAGVGQRSRAIMKTGW